MSDCQKCGSPEAKNYPYEDPWDVDFRNFGRSWWLCTNCFNSWTKSQTCKILWNSEYEVDLREKMMDLWIEGSLS